LWQEGLDWTKDVYYEVIASTLGKSGGIEACAACHHFTCFVSHAFEYGVPWHRSCLLLAFLYEGK